MFFMQIVHKTNWALIHCVLPGEICATRFSVSPLVANNVYYGQILRACL